MASTARSRPDLFPRQEEWQIIRDTAQDLVTTGFLTGIKTPAQARAISAHADAAVVGSAIVDIIGNAVSADGKVEKGLSVKVLEFVKSLATGVHGAWP